MTKQRAYSVLEIKAVDEEERVLTGIATTPATDRYDDIVEPKGAQFTLPIPFLWQHQHAAPIGHVVGAKVTEAGIEVSVKLAKVDEPGKLKDRLDEAWQSIKAGLVRGLSIGFQAIESTDIQGTWGRRFTKWDWLELSAVTIPANAEASIQSVKSFDQQQRAASGQSVQRVVRVTPPGASGNPPAAKAKTTPKPKEGYMNIAEQIKALEASRAEKAARMNELTEKSMSEGRTKDAAEREEFETLRDEIKSLDDEIKDLRELEQINQAKAAPVAGGAAAEAAKARAGAPVNAVQLKPQLEKGIEFARFAMCLGAAKGDLPQAYELAKSRFADSPQLHTVLKAAVAAGTTTDATWAGPLVEYNQFAGDFVEYLRPRTIIGRFGADGIPDLRRIPFNVHIRGQTSGGAGFWVGQGKPIGVTKFDFNDVQLGYTKVAGLAVLTEELLRFSNPAAERLVRDALADVLIATMDVAFVDPTNAGETDVKPASITNGVTQIQSAGTDADGARADVKAAMSTFIAANITPTAGVWIMDATTALTLSLMRNALGQKEFPDLTMLGGRFEGLPVIVSEHLAADSNGHFLVLANASDIWHADDNQVVVSASREASIQMLDNPTNASADGTATTMVSMFQTESVAMKAIRWVNWKKRRSAAVAVVAGVNYVA